MFNILTANVFENWLLVETFLTSELGFAIKNFFSLEEQLSFKSKKKFKQPISLF